MMQSARLLAMFSVLALVACRDATGNQPEPSDAPTAPAPPAATGSGSGSGEVIEPQYSNQGTEGITKKKDGSKGDQQDNEWTPAEFKQGSARWKDTGVYVDGKPIGFLTFGELPITLKPTWVKDKVSQNKPPNCPECPSWKWSQQRFYKFTDYLKAIGIDPRKVKVMHVYGPRLSQSVVATPAHMRAAVTTRANCRRSRRI
jgi:hypothetical protein